MPKVSRSYLHAKRFRILSAAAVCFSLQGFHRATMQDIVRQSQLSPGAIYNYFESKEKIIEAIAAERLARQKELFAQAKTEAPIVDTLKRIRNAFLGELKSPKERLRRRVSIQLWAEAQRNPRILRLIRRSVEAPRRLLAELLANAQRRGEIHEDVDPGAAAGFLVATFHGLALQVEWDRRFDLEPHDQLLDRFLETISR